MRQIVLDTETTGLEVERGHRIIEIGCVELVNRKRTNRTFHHYLRPDREIDEAAQEVHGISSKMLADKPQFAEILGDFKSFIAGAELVIHNAEFDLGFLNREYELAGETVGLRDCFAIVDTLTLARQLHPGQRNSLDALCRRYQVDNSGRDLHGALLDAKLLADVYLAMTGGQGKLSLETAQHSQMSHGAYGRPVNRENLEFTRVRATQAELDAHEQQLDRLDESCPEGALWRRLEVD